MNGIGSALKKTKQLAELWGQVRRKWEEFCVILKVKLSRNHKKLGEHQANNPVPH